MASQPPLVLPIEDSLAAPLSALLIPILDCVIIRSEWIVNFRFEIRFLNILINVIDECNGREILMHSIPRRTLLTSLFLYFKLFISTSARRSIWYN